ncbi:hypothetical protein LMBIIBHN_01493 [Aeromonas salmonicida]
MLGLFSTKSHLDYELDRVAKGDANTQPSLAEMTAKVMEIWHWNGFFVVISVAAGVSALLLLPFLKAQAPRPLAAEAV